MTDFARLGLEVDTTSTDAASKSLDDLAESADRVAESYEGVGKRLEKQGVTMEEMRRRQAAAATSQDDVTASTKRAQNETEKYMSQLQRQVETFGMSRAQLQAYRANQLQFTDEQANVVANNLLLLQSFEKTGSGLEALGIHSQRARNELGLLARDLLRGDFSQVGERLGRFIGQSDVSFGVILRFIAPVVALGGAIIGVAKAYHDGAEEAEKFNNAILISGNYAGVTSDQMLRLARSTAAAGDITVGVAKDIVRELVGSGQISQKALEQIAMLTESFAKATGKDVTKVTQDLIKIFADPAKGAEELNKQLNFLDVSQTKYLKTLMDYGREGDAQVFLAERLKERLKDVDTQGGLLERTWNRLKQEASGAWDAMLNLGRPKSLETQLAEAQAALEVAEKKFKFRPNQSLGGLISAGTEVDNLLAAVQAQKDAAQAAGDQAEKLRQQRIEEEIMKGLREESFSGQVRLAEAENKARKDAIEGQFKLFQISQEERDRRLLAADLELAKVRLRINDERLGQEGITRVETARLTTESIIIEANRKARVTQFEQAQELIRQQREMAQAQATAQSQGQTAAGQLNTIEEMQKANEALRQRRREMGLTAEQVDILRQAELDLAIAAKEVELARTVEDTPEDDPYVQRLKAQIELLKERRSLESSTDTIAVRQAGYENQLELLRQAREQGIITESEFNEEARELAVRHESAMTGITNRGYLERLRFSKMTTLEQSQFVLSTLEQTLAGAAQHNRAAFEAHKVVSIANAVVSTATGAAKALEWGWPLGPIFAAAIVAAGAIQIATIAGSQFQGGTAATGSAAAPLGESAVSTTTPSTATTAQSAPPPAPRTIIVRGLKLTDVLTGQALRDLMAEIRQEGRDGVVLFED